MLATLSYGLRDDSRIKMKLSGAKIDPKTMLFASAVDYLAINVWMQTEDGHKGRNKPKSIVEALTKEDYDSNEDILTFDSFEEFEAMRKKIIGEV